MLKNLKKLGKVRTLVTKTSVVLSPKATTTYHDVRKAIQESLNPKTGKAFYVNLRTGKGLQISKHTQWRWRFALQRQHASSL